MSEEKRLDTNPIELQAFNIVVNKVGASSKREPTFSQQDLADIHGAIQYLIEHSNPEIAEQARVIRRALDMLLAEEREVNSLIRLLQECADDLSLLDMSSADDKNQFENGGG
ncbi:MAG: hypothetical protein ABH820_02785 [Patescibacteria group bacterium]|nr:hypothetical protein [Patescibacteria group bacterium]